jgi:hypothetical protein
MQPLIEPLTAPLTTLKDSNVAGKIVLIPSLLFTSNFPLIREAQSRGAAGVLASLNFQCKYLIQGIGRSEGLFVIQTNRTRSCAWIWTIHDRPSRRQLFGHSCGRDGAPGEHGVSSNDEKCPSVKCHSFTRW